MEKPKRAIHIDFHTMPGIDDFAKNISAKELVNQLKKANVNYVNITARCNIGFSYYPTKIGFPYFGMKNDLFGEMLKECKKNGITAVAYLNGGLNHELTASNTGMLKISKDGKVYSGDFVNNNFFRTPCYNRGFKDYLLEEIKEILAYDPDGIFCDCMMAHKCYCPECIKSMENAGIDIQNDESVYAYSVKVLKDVMAEIRKIVPPEKKLYLNSFPYPDIQSMVSHVELEALTAGFWGFDYFPAEAPYYRKFSNEKIYMSGAFVSDWGDFGGKKSVPAIENDVYDALMYGYYPSIGDHMHPRDGLNKKLYENIGEIYSYVERLEKWTYGKTAVTEVAVLRNKYYPNEVSEYFTKSDKSVARMLSELKICFDVVNEDMDFSGYKLLILPDRIKITKKLSEKLKRFEGSILSTGKSIAKSPVWDYVSEFSVDENTDGFYEYNGDVFGQYSQGVKMKSDYSISDYIEPYFKKEFDGRHGYFYNPPKSSKGFSAVAKKGNKAHICFNIFEGYFDFGAHFHKKLVNDLIMDLMPERLIETSLPSTSRATLLADSKETLLQIKTTYPEIRCGKGIVEEHVLIPAGKTISVKGEYKTVLKLPELIDLKSEIKEGRTNITLPGITGYIPILLK